ncbi:MAG: ATP-dependent Clp protease ATP-binding subunit, partial [Oscillospiraceae bacterium]|nr:ATP-dependent Clp protease ATP-binding subunit [Oscillospiraceae bacterium]
MILCSKCKKRPAVVFISGMQSGEEKNEGLCLVCAKDRHIPEISDYLKRNHISEEDLEDFSEQMMDMMQETGMDQLAESMDNPDEPIQGTIDAMPSFLRNLFGGSMQSGSSGNSSGSGRERHTRDKSSKKKQDKPEYKFLDNYCTNLSKRAEEGKLDRIVGRDREIARSMQILSRRQKNNPCLIGEPGVGKTAIAEGIAQSIAEGKAPFHLLDKKIYLLDLTALVAGTQFRGQFESRVKGLIADVLKAGNVILFIDEVHNLVGAGDSEGS